MEGTQVFQQSRILISTDSFRLIAALTDILSQLHPHLRLTASNQAIAAYNEWAPDLIIVDLHTQFDHGLAHLIQLKAIVTDAVPILALTAWHTAAVRQAALTHGAQDILALPCEAMEALALARHWLALNRWQHPLEPPYMTADSQGQPRSDVPSQEVQSNFCQRLARLVDCRDRTTGSHVIRMGRYAAALGRAAGLGATESDLLQQASPLHDLGKIAIPDRILLKPAPLEPDEWSMMQAHTTIGADLLTGDDSDLLRMAHDAALTHHEKWDGSGYPQGLGGESIPLVGRITAICDVFDALTSERPYKPAWPVPDAVTAIRRQAGRHFEPRLVEQFCAILPELLTIKEQFAAPNTTDGSDDT